jgi:pimeloyl-ACP methyl ester carboxylesterase
MKSKILYFRLVRFIAGILLVLNQSSNSFAEGKHVNVNGLKMYYEIHGVGTPLVLLHGGLMTIDSSFSKILPSLAKSWQVIAVEQQGHGHTADRDRPLTYEQMADDTATLLKSLKIENADFFGYSDGGNVALGIAIRHSELVRKLAIAGVNYNNDGLYPEVIEFMKNAKAEDVGPEMQNAYVSVAPRPENWPTLVRKVMDMTLKWKGWRVEDLRSIKAPVLIMIGDADIVKPEHAVEMVRLVPQSQLAVLPGTDHEEIIHRADWVLSMLIEFLKAPIAEHE